MYETVSVSKLSDSQKSKLRNGHPVRIKKGAGNTLCLNNDQIKKLESAAKKGKAVTITLHGEQIEKHGSGVFGDIASRIKKKLTSAAASEVQNKIEQLTTVANDGIDAALKVEGEGMRRKRGRPKKGGGFPKPKTVKDLTKKRKGKGIGALAKMAVKALVPIVIDEVADVAREKVAGMGIKKKRGTGLRKKNYGGALFPAGGALYPAGYSGN